jgi:hypothetical protein
MKKLLIQLDTDPLPSTFDRVVASDAGADEIFAYGGVTPEAVTALVHGAIFTRKASELNHTAIFVGGSQVEAGEAVYRAVRKAFFGPLRVSVMMDSNGSNTTAAAAVVSAAKHLDLSQITATVLGGTGPVGCRAAQLLASLGTRVNVVSRSEEKANDVCERLGKDVDRTLLTPVGATTSDAILTAARDSRLLISAGAAGVELLPADAWSSLKTLSVAIDVNAVPPLGLGGIEVMDKGKDRGGVICYGAIGVGGTKMKIHHACLRKLFESNTQEFDTQAIFAVARES